MGGPTIFISVLEVNPNFLYRLRVGLQYRTQMHIFETCIYLGPPRHSRKKTTIQERRLVEGVKTHNVKLIKGANYESLTSREIFINENVLIFSDATFRKAVGKAGSGMVMKLKRSFSSRSSLSMTQSLLFEGSQKEAIHLALSKPKEKESLKLAFYQMRRGWFKLLMVVSIGTLIRSSWILMLCLINLIILILFLAAHLLAKLSYILSGMSLLG